MNVRDGVITKIAEQIAFVLRKKSSICVFLAAVKIEGFYLFWIWKGRRRRKGKGRKLTGCCCCCSCSQWMLNFKFQACSQELNILRQHLLLLLLLQTFSTFSPLCNTSALLCYALLCLPSCIHSSATSLISPMALLLVYQFINFRHLLLPAIW